MAFSSGMATAPATKPPMCAQEGHAAAHVQAHFAVERHKLPQKPEPQHHQGRQIDDEQENQRVYAGEGIRHGISARIAATAPLAPMTGMVLSLYIA